MNRIKTVYRGISAAASHFAPAILGTLLASAAATANADAVVDAKTMGTSDAANLTTSQSRQYTFSWMFTDDAAMKPRGGTTKGPALTLDDSSSEAFIALQAPGLSNQERDRRAIVAMAGDYRTTFDFIETVGLTAGYEPRQPYQSWGTERVYVVANEADFVSLQHIIVMHFMADDGSISEPVVVKHWRQDWRYQDNEVHEFVGRNRFQRVSFTDADVAGTWSQTVYQVDDSPRYEAIGRWVHADGASFWESEDRRRPLPRREFSVRDDYQALYGSHRITVHRTGWSMEEDALKLVLDADNNPSAEQPYLAREAGLSRYDRIADYDFSAGDDYWQRTAPFWATVRAYWQGIYDDRERFAFRKQVEDSAMFRDMFALADGPALKSDEAQVLVADALAPYLIDE